MTEPDRRTYDTPGRRLTDQLSRVEVDAFTNGAAKKLRRIEHTIIACLVAFLIAVPGLLWSASKWTTSIEDSLTAVAVRDSVMLRAIQHTQDEVIDHRAADEARDAALAAGVNEISTTMAGVVAVQRDLQEEVRRLRDRE